MKIKNQKSKTKITNQGRRSLNRFLDFSMLFWILIFVLCILSLGCEAFVRKFTRKPKKDKLPAEEIVLAPEEYTGAEINKEELYRQYFLFWKSWHSELIESFLQKRSKKKKIDCAKEAKKNLRALKPMLNIDMQKKLDIYLNRLDSVIVSIEKDLYGLNDHVNMQNAEQIKRDILREFSYRKVKDNLI